MATLPVVPEVMQDIVETDAERELWTIVREHERPPFWHEGEGVGCRLNRAARIILDGRLTPNSDGSYTVTGAEGRTYRVDKHCSCPDSQHRQKTYCYHYIAVCLYVEWTRRMGHPTMQGALPLPPVSVDERLAQTPPVAAQEPLGEESPMSDADYIPEPDDAPPVAVQEAPTRAVTTPATSSLDARALLESMAAWREQRQILARYIKEQLTEGVDYYTLRIKGRDTKPTLSKAGSEKFLAIFKLTASFQQDAATWQMLGAKEGTLCYTCQLLTREGQVVGEGRGARTLAQDQGDINKAVKMAQKSAQIDAILRTGCLSDVFTQDINEPEEAPAPPTRPSSADLRQRIWQLVKAADATITTREACEAYVKRATNLALEPNNYSAILIALEKEFSDAHPPVAPHQYPVRPGQ